MMERDPVEEDLARHLADVDAEESMRAERDRREAQLRVDFFRSLRAGDFSDANELLLEACETTLEVVFDPLLMFAQSSLQSSPVAMGVQAAHIGALFERLAAMYVKREMEF